MGSQNTSTHHSKTASTHRLSEPCKSSIPFPAVLSYHQQMHFQAVIASFLPPNGGKNMKYDFISITFLHPEYQTDGNNYRWVYISYTRSQMLHSLPIEIWNESLNEFSLSRTKLVKKGKGIWPNSYIFPWLLWEYSSSNLLLIQLCPHRSFCFFLLPMEQSTHKLIFYFNVILHLLQHLFCNTFSCVFHGLYYWELWLIFWVLFCPHLFIIVTSEFFNCVFIYVAIPRPELQLMQTGICCTEANEVKLPNISWEQDFCTWYISSLSMEPKIQPKYN